jgi:hypothetical protein
MSSAEEEVCFVQEELDLLDQMAVDRDQATVDLNQVAVMGTEEETQQQETSFLVPDMPARERHLSSTTPLFIRNGFGQGAKKVQTQVKVTRVLPRPQYLPLPKEERRRHTFAHGAKKIQKQVKVTRVLPRPQCLPLPKEERRRHTFGQGAKKIQTQVKVTRVRPRPPCLPLPKEA